MFLTTKEGGMAQAFPNVCQVPSPSGPVPTPFPSLAQCTDADGGTCSSKVTVRNKAVLHVRSEVPMTRGDEPGTSGGVVSGTRGDVCTRSQGSSKVEIEGDAAVAQLMRVRSNGTNANAPTGAQLSPSQTKVRIGS